MNKWIVLGLLMMWGGGCATHREIHTTVDFNYDIRDPLCKERPTTAAIDNMMKQLRLIGVERVYWMHYAEDYYIPQPLRDPAADVLTYATKAAHDNGMEMWALFKPFETGRSAMHFPQNVKFPEGAVTVEGIGGNSFPIARFVMEHPDLRIERRPLDRPWDVPVGMVKLVKADTEPTRLNRDNLTLYTSSINTNFEPYRGDYTFTDTLEERDGKLVRVLTFSGLNIPVSQRYLLVIPSIADENADFQNTDDKMMEIYDHQGKPIPVTWDEGLVDRNYLKSMFGTYFFLQWGLGDWADRFMPEGFGETLPTSSFMFDRAHQLVTRYLDGVMDPGRSVRRNGFKAVAKGKNMHLIGSLHPCYPEVRRYWLDEIRDRCVKAGVDGITIRISNHSCWTSEREMYGFNQPVVDEYMKRYGVDIRTEPWDEEKLKEINGEYLTLFLRELKENLKKADLPLQLHVNFHFGAEVPGSRANNVPWTFAYDWKEWIEDDIADSIELKYLPFPWGSARGMGQDFMNEVVAFAKEHDKPVYYDWRLMGGIPWQADLTDSKWDAPDVKKAIDQIRETAGWGWNDPNIDGVILYEVDSYTSINSETDEVLLSPFVRQFVHDLKTGKEPKPTE
ncbi:hypothetical protein HQ520_18235 [bacterium]|nr:hypothetical protein [bacterium]